MIAITRRNLMAVGAGMLASAAAGPSRRPALAAAPLAGKQAPGFFRQRVGDIEVTVLSDGFFELPSDSIATNVPPEERKAYLEAHFVPLDKFPLQASPVLINTRDKLVLVDSGVGAGAGWAPGAGRLLDTLAAVGVAPEAIDVVVLTHGHADHVGGLVPVDAGVAGAPRFPNAEIVLSDIELGLWTGGDISRLPEWAAQNGLAWHEAIFGALRERLRPIKAGTDVVAGVRSLDTRGHTQGHLSLMVDSADQQLLLTGDAIANIHIAFGRPDWQIIWDHDRELGAKTRARLLDQLATDRLLVAGYHYPFPGIGHVVRDGTAYRWLPADWTWTL
jgi:glyoxylase-like metal-dependent hydrolase (beta-lactamase superfamily II)